MSCECNLAGLLSMNYSGIISANINGGTNVALSSDGVVLLGQTLNTLSISAYAFTPGQDMFLGASCAASANASVQWIQRYSCVDDRTFFIPKSGGKSSITGGPLNGVALDCDPNITSQSFSASAQSGPTTPYITAVRRDGFNLRYSGVPIQVESASPSSYSISLGPVAVVAYLQSFSLSVSPPSPATVNYSFVVPGTIL